MKRDMEPVFPDKMDVLIVTALAEELDAVRQFLEINETIYSNDPPLTYHIASIQCPNNFTRYEVALTCLFQMGNPESGVLVSGAIRDLNPTYIIMLGIAGGVRGQTDLGDVVVSTNLFYYEQGKLRPDEIEIRPNAFTGDFILKNRLEEYASQLNAEYVVRFGPFAIGEKVVADSSTVEKLKSYEPKLLGIEMESYGVASAASHAISRPRFIAIRGVSDHADEKKDDSWRDEALHHAAGFVIGFLEHGSLPQSPHAIRRSEETVDLIAIHHLSMYRQPTIDSTLSHALKNDVSTDTRSLNIDQTDFYQQGTIRDPVAAFEMQRGFGDKLFDLLDLHQNAKIAYFGLAHIPFVVHMGYSINRCAVQTFVTDRATSLWHPLDPEADSWPELRVEGKPIARSEDTQDIAILFGVSYSIEKSLLHQLPLGTLTFIHLSLDNPHTDVVTSEPQLNDYTLLFHQTLVYIHNQRPNARALHLFYAGPPTLAFRIGQQVSMTVDTDFYVYNYSVRDQPNYGWALNLRTESIVDIRGEEYANV